MLYTPKISFVVTLRCNLKCKLCAAHSPYYQKPFYPSTDDLFLKVDKFFSVVSSVGDFTLSGGEPFLRKDLSSIINYIGNYYQKIKTLEIITNGTLAPTTSLVDSLSQYPGAIRIIIDDYGSNLSINVEKITSRLRSFDHIKIDIHDYHSDNMHCNGWVDYGINSIPPKSEEEALLTFKKCAIPQKLKCLSYIDGCTYLCSQSRRCMELGLTTFNTNECVNLFDNQYSTEELREKIAKQYLLDKIEACRFCNGLCDDSNRYKPAEQLCGGRTVE